MGNAVAAIGRVGTEAFVVEEWWGGGDGEAGCGVYRGRYRDVTGCIGRLIGVALLIIRSCELCV
jgi:hypothetical protein